MLRMSSRVLKMQKTHPSIQSATDDLSTSSAATLGTRTNPDLSKIIACCGTARKLTAAENYDPASAFDPKSLTALISTIATQNKAAGLATSGCESCSAGEDVTIGAMVWLPFVHVDLALQTVSAAPCTRRIIIQARARFISLKSHQENHKPRIPKDFAAF